MSASCPRRTREAGPAGRRRAEEGVENVLEGEALAGVLPPPKPLSVPFSLPVVS